MRAFLVTTTLAAAASASPSRVSNYVAAGVFESKTANTTTSQEPCGLVSKQWEQSNGTEVNAALAYDCLQSVPIKTTKDLLQLEGIKAFVQFQSTLAYLKDPPIGYLYPPVDIYGALDQIAQKLNSSGYSTEYDFQMELYNVISSAYDGHFNYIPDIVAAFSFGRLTALYSLSSDGLALPEVYAGSDPLGLIPAKNGTITNTTVSPVAQINGVDVQTWLNEYASLEGSNQDPDANYNAIFANVPLGSNGQFTTASHYQGTETVLTFRNGTTRNFANYASTSLNLTGVTDGESFFERCCTPQSSSEQISSAPSSTSTMAAIPTTEVPFRPVPTQTATPGPVSYPWPIVVNGGSNPVAGYHPKQAEDLAVLSIPSFESEDSTQFSNVVREFLATSQAAGKNKLIIDLRGNGGGSVNLAYDLFAQLFPNLYPYGATNFRATPLLDDVGIIVSQFYSNITNVTASFPKDCTNDFALHPFNYREQLTLNNTAFTSWEQLYGPYEQHGDNFTALTRYNLNDEFSIFCMNISNYGNLTHITPQVFQPSDIVLVQDGACASTCAVFAEFMKTQANVQSIVFGGRHQIGPMQAVGGVKGGNVYDYDILSEAISLAANNDSTPAQKKAFYAKYGYLEEPFIEAINRASVGSAGLAARVNVRNNIRDDDSTITPLQFVYEAADCRLFYTAEMILEQSLVWSAAYNVCWGNGSCVASSTGHPSALPGCDVASNTPPDSARNFFGANVTSVYPVDLKPSTNSSNKSDEPPAASTSTISTPTPFTGGASKIWSSLSGLIVVAVGFACFT